MWARGWMVAGLLGCSGGLPVEEGRPLAADLVGDPAAGHELYRAHCLSCHQSDGSGHGGRLAPDLRSQPVQARADDELLTVIRDGRRGSVGVMPGWGRRLTPQQQADLLAHIRGAFGR